MGISQPINRAIKTGLNTPIFGDPDATASTKFGESFWMAPTLGDITALAYGDNTGATSSGSPVYQAGPTYHAGTVGMIRNGSSHLYFPNAGGPFEDISKSFWIAGAFRLTSATNYQCLCGNGGDLLGRKGFRVRVRGGSAPRIAIDIADGTTKVTKSFDHRRDYPVGTGADDFVCIVIECKIAAGVPTVRVTSEMYGIYGSTASQATFTGLDMTAGGEPELKGLVIGSYNQSSTNAFSGDIVLQGGELVGDEFMSSANRYMLGNYNRSRLYADAIASRDKVLGSGWFHSADGGGFELRIVSEEAMTAKAYDVATRTLQGTSAETTSPSNDFQTRTITGLTADQEIAIEFEDSAGVVQHRELRGRVLPAADNDLTVASIGCFNLEDDTNLGTHSSTFTLIRGMATKPDFTIITEDFGYVDPSTTNIADYVTRWKTIIADEKAMFFMDHMPHIWGFGDHNFEDDADSTSDKIEVGEQFARLALPVASAGFRHATEGVDFAVSLNDYRFISMDTVTGKTDSVMMSSAAQTWWIAQLATANTNEQIVLNNWVKIIDFTGSVNSQKWKYYDDTFSSSARDQINQLFDAIETEFGTSDDHFVSFSGDVHLSGIDDGSNHGDYDTGNNLSLPTIHSSRWVHSVGENVSNTAFSNAERNQQGNFGYLEFTDSVTTVSMAAKQFENTTQQGTTLTVTLTK